MRPRRFIVVGMTFVALVVMAVSADANTLRGQVQSITITHCGLKPGDCEGYLTLASNGRAQQVLVTKETTITRAGKPILLGELGTGNVVTLNDYETVRGTGAVRPKSIQAP